MDLGNDLRLLFLLALNAAILAAAWYAARRWTRDGVQRAADAMLVWYLVQYAAVALPGVLHVLSLATMSLVGSAAATALFIASRKSQPLTSDLSRTHAGVYLVAAVALATFLVQIIRVQNWQPLIDSDAITYHAPAAVQWLQTGRLGLLPTPFFNPANTFSPLAGSTFIAWALAPMNGDSLARFVQAPAIFLLFLGVLQLARALGANPYAAAALAVAAAGGRLCSSEVANPRDDMFLAAFVLVAFAGCAPDRLRERAGPWRVGVALGLALATKYTALISLPLLLLMLDAPVKAGWSRRQWLVALGCPLLIAGPWYLRNLVLAGNPLYPLEVKLFGVTLLKGLFVTERSLRLRTFAGVKDVFIEGYHGLPTAAAWAFASGWVTAIVVSVRRYREPMVRACLFGPLACAALFLVKSPYAEVRFLFPAIFVVVGFVGVIGVFPLTPVRRGEGRGEGFFGRRKSIGNRDEPLTPNPSPLRTGARGTAAQACLAVVALILLVTWLATSYKNKELLAEALIPALVAVPVAAGLFYLDAKLGRSARARGYAATAALLVLAAVVYTAWSPYVATVEYHAPEMWRSPQYYPLQAGGWSFVRENVPADAVLAYTQTFNIYPLYGTHLSRRVVYVPVRPDVPGMLHVPHFPKPLPGEPINDTFTGMLNANADKPTWLARLKGSGATYLFVYVGNVPNAPEARWAQDTPGFERIYEDKGVWIYRLAL